MFRISHCRQALTRALRGLSRHLLVLLAAIAFIPGYQHIAQAQETSASVPAAPATTPGSQAAAPAAGVNPGGGVELPSVVVEQTSPKAAKPKRIETAHHPKPAAPSPRRATPPVLQHAPSAPQANPPMVASPAPNTVDNSGTPSSGVAAIIGAASTPGAQTATAIDAKSLQSEPVFSAGDLLNQSPGISLKQGNGPRDLGISIRGSNARNGYGIRNIVIFDDGFPVTQPDGLSRSDLNDPHAYPGVDVWRGPSSTLFGNYATGGAINFRTWPGGAIDGVEYGVDGGSFNYWNNYLIAGTKTQNFEGSLFLSHVRGDGYFGYSAFNTQTANALLTYQLTSRDTLTLKFIDNQLDTELPFRMSLDQFNDNSFQKGCERALNASQGCATNNFSATGTSPFVSQTAEQAGAGRDDRRTIGGIRWDHEFDANTTGEIQLVVDDRNISQPTGTTSAIGDYLSYNLSTSLTHIGTIAGFPTRSLIGTYFDTLPVDSFTYSVAPGGSARLGDLQSETEGSTTNWGVRERQEVALRDDVIMTAGVAVERSWLSGTSNSFTYDPSGLRLSDSTVDADRIFTNVAPEIGLLWKPSSQWQYRARIGTGYGTPQFTNLFITPDGEPGNNTDLKPQTNIGYDVGTDWIPLSGVTFTVTGFYEFFQNEIVSQSPGPGLPSFTFNAPRSEHRGVEAQANVAVTRAITFTAAYLYDDQSYTDYQERLSGSSMLFNRAGKKIPGVSPDELTLRLAYDQPEGRFRGWGMFAEYQWQDSFFMENANLLKAPGYDIVNVNVHYNADLQGEFFRSFTAYVQVDNVFDTTYVASANNITDSLGATADSLAEVSGSIYSGAPQTFYAGAKMRF